ncbi:hypothetical protein [Sabulicella rubraurantiaca]|uniref:hypothetical protein n=1 Tax=Sabulicella rubraurantiaca TaxID=2811429 RepID=UPI001A96F6C6|nr:hypothetical protein [Sabulicella rubraurantiaca]
MPRLMHTLLSATMLLAGCTTAVSDMPYPWFTEFPAALQTATVAELQRCGAL